jgi:hypothetical protein
MRARAAGQYVRRTLTSKLERRWLVRAKDADQVALGVRTRLPDGLEHICLAAQSIYAQ